MFSESSNVSVASLINASGILYLSDDCLRKDKAGRPRQRTGGGGAQRWICSKFLRGHGLDGCKPGGRGDNDKQAASRRMQAAWTEYRRVADDPVAMAEAKQVFCFLVVLFVFCCDKREVGNAATNARARGGKSFGMAPSVKKGAHCVKQPKWQREVRACYGLTTTPAVCDASLGAVNVLAPMHRVAAGGWGTIATLRKETDNAIKADVDCADGLRKWSSDKQVAGGVFSGVEFDASHLPLNGFVFCEVVPPALAIAERMAEVVEYGKHGNVGKAAANLVDIWESRHTTFKHDDAPSFCEQPDGVGSLRNWGACCECGFCVCGKKRPPPLLQPLVWFIKGQVAKGCPHKAVYESCALVAQVSSDSDESFFFMLASATLTH